ncbi:hypothetical protein M9H77_30191 [Catharanthus roseus]|uniref:Uncharacterized protein n=1 Tax=Catharanthus roseus TaxID=4058 RepID=A0ACB9ZWW6_CATRO|nr:hypothetical protein M9H77_30191 [Catharanthus roseus]
MKVLATVLIIKEEMLTAEATIVVPNSLEEDKVALVTSLIVLDLLSIFLISAMREIELRQKMVLLKDKGVGFNTWSELKGTLSDKFGVGQLERLERSQEIGKSKEKQEIYISSQGIKKEVSMKASLLGKFSMGIIPNFLDLFDGKIHVKKVEKYLCSLIEDLLDKSIRRIVETYSYMIPSFETSVIALKGIGLFETIS